jgi:ATP synthase protein I
MALNSLEVDLTEDLMEPSNSVLERQVEAARLGLPTDEAITADKPRWRVISTRREQQQWDRASKAATGGTGLLLRNLNKSREDPAVIAAQSKQHYIQLKQRLQLITLGLGGLGTVSAYISYSPEVAASFGAGLLGSLAYIRMLGNSVDSYGVEGVQGTVRGALGQPRLLVPVVLVMMFNRWNEILVPDFGFIHLDLIPILVGFFTYKIATFVQAIQDVLPTFGGKIQS